MSTAKPSSQVAAGPVYIRPSKIGLICKRATDILLAVSAGLLLLPVFAVVALSIKFTSPGPIIFTQRRFGKDGRFFEIYKFRTMHHGTPDIPTDQMLKMRSPITPLGGLLRSTSLDELPQLINVVKGDMSLVGPRPALHNQETLNDMRRQAGVLRFPPGITGWAQVNGRDELPDDVKVSLDKWYCDNWSYWLDWRIMLKTLGAVITRRGVN